MWQFTAFSAILMIQGAALVAACSSGCSSACSSGCSSGCSDEPTPCRDTGEQKIDAKEGSTKVARVPITTNNTYTANTCSKGTIVLSDSCLAAKMDCTFIINNGERYSCDFFYSTEDPTFGKGNRACTSGAYLAETGSKMYWMLKPEPGSPGGTITCLTLCETKPLQGVGNMGDAGEAILREEIANILNGGFPGGLLEGL